MVQAEVQGPPQAVTRREAKAISAVAEAAEERRGHPQLREVPQVQEAHTEETVVQVVRVGHLVVRLRGVRAKVPVPKKVHCITVAVMAEVPRAETTEAVEEAVEDSAQ